MALTAFVAVFATYQAHAQATISPTTWGGTNSTTAAGPSNFSPLPASTSPGAAAVAVSQWNRGPGVFYNAGGGRYNSNNWSVGAVGIATAFANGDYLTFTVTNNASTQLRITGVNIGTGQASGTGPNTFGLMYRIGTGSLITFTASASGPSPSFTGTAFTLCAGETVTFYMPGWGGTGSSGTYSINTNATLSAQFISAVNATASSTSPVPAGSPLTFSSSVTGGVAPYTYSWTGPLSYTDATAAPVIAAPTVGANGTYSLTVTDTWGCTVQTTTPVTITAGVACSGTPTAGTAVASAAAVCNSGTSTISLSGATAASGLTYQWYEATALAGPYTLIGGATLPTYNTPVVSATTYYRCELTCTSSGFSDISSPATFTVNPLPVITGTGGDVCAGGSGLSITAGGAVSYTWAPSTGLSATTGASVTANPIINTTYTITGTDAAGCVGTHTVVVNYNLVPSTISIAPSPVTACLGGAAALVTATGGTVGPTTLNSGSITIPASIAAFGTISRSLEMSGIPAGAVITGASVNVISFGSQYQDDYVVNITAPNGNRLNLINQRGSHTATVTTLFANTNLSSAGGPSLATGSGTFTGTWSADAAAGVGAAPFAANVTNWTSLYSVPNGTWTLSIYNNTGFTNVVVPTAQWSITLNYSYQAPITWSPATNLYTDAAATVPYTGGATNSVYFNPASLSAGSYTAVATNATCTSSATVVTTVNPLPASIAGATNVCVGATIALANTTTGGTWSTTSTNAAVDAATGVVTGISAGTADISYVLPTGCFVTTTVTVNALPTAITGTLTVCTGSTQTLSNAVTGGTWASSSTNATIDATTGVATGVSVGTSDITYTLPTGCFTTAVLTVNLTPAAITGATDVCIGFTTTLANATTGGTWSTASTNASVDVATGVVTGIAAGTADVSYILPSGCFATTIITVNALPPAISGTLTVCTGSTRTLSNAVAGGTWASSNTNATIDATTGVATGVTTGTSIITYTLPTGCYTTDVITINPLPADITGLASVCEAGGTTVFSSATAGGTWTSSNVNATIDAATGVATGVTAGTSFITYSLATGCTDTLVLTINSLPAAIAGALNVCEGSTTALSSATTGGAWSSSTTSAATIDVATGVVAGIAAGTTVITYTGLNTCITTATVTVNVLPPAITGTSSVCVAASVALSNTVTGGTWSSSNANATVDAITGVATGAVAGTATITYTLGTGCFVTYVITIDPIPTPITGTIQVCEGASTALSTTPAGGVWSASSIHIAVGVATGTVAGLSAGTAVVTYTLPTSCAATIVVTVNTQPSAISGTSSVCVGAGISQSASPAGGVWSASNTNVAIDAVTGNVTGITSGTSIITYTVAGICFSIKTITVNPLPAAITGPSGVCLGSNITLTNATAGGTWSASNVIVAVGATTGVVAGSSAGTSVVTYTIPTGCYITSVITVNSLPGGITGSTGVCTGRTSSLSSLPAGGTWSSSSTNATVDAATGVVTGVSVGTAEITYSLSTGCVQSVVVTVNLLPAAISGSLQVCEGYTTLLTNTTGGGTWSSSNLATVHIDAAGLATGISVGTATITYALGTGCTVEAEVTVNPVPLATTGTLTVCQGNTTVLSNPTAGGTWSSADLSIATVDASGIVTGVSGGSVTISYILPTGCFALVSVTVDPIPAAISGGTAVCAGFATTLFSSPTGGTWSSTDTAIARVNSITGVLSGVVAGNTTITYTLPTGCSITTLATVNPLPPVITGTATVCEAGTTILSNGIAGGTWTSGNPSLAIIDAITGVVTGVVAGTVSISYTIPTGCFNTRIVTVNPLPAPITGTTVICQGRTSTLSTSPAGGFWNSGATAVATVISATGAVTGITAGTAEITYTLPTGCLAARVVTINPGPSPIVGNPNICLGSTATFSDTVLGGVWSSTTPTVATVGTSGVVTGFTLGTSTISYTLPVTGCYSSVVVTVQPLPNVYTVVGGGTYCAGGTGVTVGLSMSEPGVTYSLVYGSSTTAFVSGTGSPISFGLHTAAGVYTVQATNAITACSRNMAGSATIVIQPLLTPSVGISTAPSDTLCAGESVLLTPTPVLGGTAPVYNWSVNGTYVATGATYTFVPANGDVVRVGMTSNAACLLTDTAVGARTLSVFVPAMPVVTTIVSPSDTSCEFSPVNFTATPVNGGPTPVYSWLVDGIVSGSGPVFSYAPSDADVVVCKLYSNYRCRLADSVLSAPINMTVLPIPSPAVTITSSPSLALVPGQSFTLTATATDAGAAPVYQWLKNGVPIVGATTAVHTDVAVIGVTEYTCRVTSSGFCGGLTSFNLVYVNGSPSNSTTNVVLAEGIRLSPNPNNGTFTLSGNTGGVGNAEIHITITNMLGQVVHQQELSVTNGTINAEINLNNSLANGMYLLNMNTGTKTSTLHFTIGK